MDKNERNALIARKAELEKNAAGCDHNIEEAQKTVDAFKNKKKLIQEELAAINKQLNEKADKAE